MHTHLARHTAKHVYVSVCKLPYAAYPCGLQFTSCYVAGVLVLLLCVMLVKHEHFFLFLFKAASATMAQCGLACGMLAAAAWPVCVQQV